MWWIFSILFYLFCLFKKFIKQFFTFLRACSFIMHIYTLCNFIFLWLYMWAIPRWWLCSWVFLYLIIITLLSYQIIDIVYIIFIHFLFYIHFIKIWIIILLIYFFLIFKIFVNVYLFIVYMLRYFLFVSYFFNLKFILECITCIIIPILILFNRCHYYYKQFFFILRL